MNHNNRCTININPEHKIVTCSSGDNLLQVLNENDIGIKSLCGGEGTCNKCLVVVNEGNCRELKKPQIKEKDQRYVLACQVEVEGDIKITIPEKSRLNKQQILTKDSCEIEKNIFADGKIEPLCLHKTMEFPPPSLIDNSADLERFKRVFQKETGIENISFPHSLLKKLPSKFRKADWKLVVFWLEEQDTAHILDFDVVDKNDFYGIALDIGTTTAAGKLINLINHKTCATTGIYNRQIKYGEDVITRINYCKQHRNGMQKMTEALIESINELITKLCQEKEIERDAIKTIVAAGNTTMIHTLYGLNPNNIRRDPYIPAASNLPPITAAELNIDILPTGLIQVFPAIGSFVGGDITAGVLASNLYKKEDLTLLIDIGTNGEIVLGNSEFLISCSASAGPAFEGGGITHGVRAMEGAIEKVSIHPWNGEVKYKTVNNKRPIGICGSGLIELLAELQEQNLINRSGKFNDNYQGKRLRVDEDGNRGFVVVNSEKTGINEDIVITENDIKNLLRSKAAVYAGIRMLLSNLSLEENMLSQVLIAGGFGNYLNLEAAIRIGLFPDLPRKCFKFIGNTSLEGARKALVYKKLMSAGLKLGRKITYLELSADIQSAKFMDEFIAAQFIPHTNLALFPSLEIKNENELTII